MIIAKNDEAKRSQIWRNVVTISSILIVLIGAYLLVKMFTANPLEGRWQDEDGAISIHVRSNGTLTAVIPEIADGENIEVPMTYSIDKDAKIVTFGVDQQTLSEAAEASDGMFDEMMLEGSLDSITSSFDYSVERNQLVLTEREYGDQLIFVRK